MSNPPPRFTIVQLLEVMRNAFEHKFSCQISIYNDPDLAAVIHFYGDEPLSDAQLEAQVFHSGSYQVRCPTWKSTNIHPLAHAMKKADVLLGLLQALYKT